MLVLVILGLGCADGGLSVEAYVEQFSEATCSRRLTCADYDESEETCLAQMRSFAEAVPPSGCYSACDASACIAAQEAEAGTCAGGEFLADECLYVYTAGESGECP